VADGGGNGGRERWWTRWGEAMGMGKTAAAAVRRRSTRLGASVGMVRLMGGPMWF
jgi:hypothetical protein